MDTAIVGILNRLRHYLPAQAPLKDFIHHNTLHAFQQEEFFAGLQQASQIFGYKVLLGIEEYRALYNQGKISEEALQSVLDTADLSMEPRQILDKMLLEDFPGNYSGRIGQLRSVWKSHYRINIDKVSHPILFRLAGNYLDQGISIWNFPLHEDGFLASIRELQAGSISALFYSPRVRKLLDDPNTSLRHLLEILVGDPKLYERYLFDQQFAHPGWSGMVAVLERNPESLLDKRRISLTDFILLELLLEIDYLDRKFGNIWPNLSQSVTESFPELFSSIEPEESFTIRSLWQRAYEWTYYDQVLSGLQCGPTEITSPLESDSFQALFCIDDRSCSLRRYVELQEPGVRTYGTPGFFQVEFYFQPEEGKFLTKVCPAPVQPKVVIREYNGVKKYKNDLHFSKHSQGLLGGWFISQTMGFWSAVQLLGNVFRPAVSPAMVSSFQHMDRGSVLGIRQDGQASEWEGLKLGFTEEEMANRIASLLGSIGATHNFSPLVYLIGHGASSVNNTYYAGYDCGACSGRAGSVNARVAAWMANQTSVRLILESKGIIIPDFVQFVGGLHDTTRDEIEFYDTENLSKKNASLHRKFAQKFNQALSLNAKERSRRFNLLSTRDTADRIHQQVKLRALSLFEPRPELNHATNAICIIGRRELSQQLFLDRRAFLNSYNPEEDPDGIFLTGILKAVAPVCGGINLEYFFSRTDPHRLGAGSKLPHNVIGLLGVANGVEGDLRPGLPTQMTEVHDPIRLLVVVEQKPDFILSVLAKESSTRQWFDNNWIHLVAIDPDNRQLYRYENTQFREYHSKAGRPPYLKDWNQLIESTEDNIPVHLLTKMK